MNEEDTLDVTTVRSESAFSGTSDEMKPVNENEILTATKYNRTYTALHVPKRLLPNYVKGDLIEVVVSRIENPHQQFILYSHTFGYRWAYVNIYRLGARLGERYRLNSLARFGLDRFVSEFNRGSRPGLQNVTMRIVDMNLELHIEEVAVQVTEVSLRSHQGGAVLEGRVGGHRIKVTKEGSQFRLGLCADKARVLRIAACAHGVVVWYKNSAKKNGESAKVIETSRSPLGLNECSSFSMEIRLLAASESFEGTHLFEIGPSLGRDAVDRLAISTGLRDYTTVKGEISETVIDRMLTMVNCPEVINHPRSREESKVVRKSSKKGPDSLRIIPEMRSAYFEFKWWKKVRQALSAGRKQVSRYCQDKSALSHEGYIAALEWSVGGGQAKLVIERICRD